MIYRVVTENSKHEVDADGQFINDGGDIIFFQKQDGAVVGGISIPTIMMTVACFAQGHWKSTEIIE